MTRCTTEISSFLSKSLFSGPFYSDVGKSKPCPPVGTYIIVYVNNCHYIFILPSISNSS